MAPKKKPTGNLYSQFFGNLAVSVWHTTAGVQVIVTRKGVVQLDKTFPITETRRA